MTEMLMEAIKAAGIMGLPPGEVNAMNADDISMGAERVVAVADDMRYWADNSGDERTAIERYRALATVREFANERWSDAARQLRRQLSGSV